MFRRLLLTLSFVVALNCVWSQILTPRQLYPGLFETVQLSDIFPDNKTFVDATAKRDPALIMKDYNDQKDKPGFDLKRFVYDNFIIPGTHNDVFKSDVRPASASISIRYGMYYTASMI